MHITPSTPGSGIFEEEQVGRLEESEMVDALRRLVSGYDRAVSGKYELSVCDNMHKTWASSRQTQPQHGVEEIGMKSHH